MEQNQDQFKNLLQKYFYQLYLGCDSITCKNKYCRSSENWIFKNQPKDQNIIAAQALQLVKTGTKNLCRANRPEINPQKIITYQKIEEYFEKNHVKDISEFESFIKEAFSSQEFYLSFSPNGDGNIVCDLENPGIDFKQIHDVFQKILQVEVRALIQINLLIIL
ncbi:hypothetical protein M0811_00363 [Anaeramoeba ignava]|uniref:Ubiquitin-protein ligase E3A N-terminal zinc-binding domain-containing protein n=1 Tax=Anaeramoeba ignava TaxID=1746090 RepID=A0A9Q0LQC8_ANAIG|nr:hypothetical protein M0811_00363 [Anaeramoeba ignava]